MENKEEKESEEAELIKQEWFLFLFFHSFKGKSILVNLLRWKGKSPYLSNQFPFFRLFELTKIDGEPLVSWQNGIISGKDKEKGIKWVTEKSSQLLLSSLPQCTYFLSLWKNCFCSSHLNFQLHPSNQRGWPRNPDTAFPHSATFFVRDKVHPAQVERYFLVLRGLLRNGLGYQGRLLPFFNHFLLKGLGVEFPLSTLLHFEEEFLSVGSYLRASPSLDELFDFLPIFPIDPETWMS